MSPLRLTSPRVLPSTGVTPLHQYYDPSDFLTTIPAFSLCRLVRRYCPPWQSDEDLPRSPCYFDDMPCSQTPGMPDITAHSVMSDGVFWVCQVMDHPKYSLNGALSLQPEGLRPTTSLSTLDPHGYPYRPKTRYQVRWVPLPGRHFQPLVTQRLVAHDKLTSQVEKTPEMLGSLDHCTFPKRL